MKKMKAAEVADFERLARMLEDLAQVEYMSTVELIPKLVVMGLDSTAKELTYLFREVPVAELMTGDAAVSGIIVVSALMEKLAQDPEVLVVGYIAEAWCARFSKEEQERLGTNLNPENAPNREEVLIMNLRSADRIALKTCPIHRDGERTTVSSGELLLTPSSALPQVGQTTH